MNHSFKQSLIITGFAIIIGLLLRIDNKLENQIRISQIDMTMEYNRGFVEGRYQMIAEIYICDFSTPNKIIQDHYFRLYNNQIENGREVYMNCGE